MSIVWPDKVSARSLGGDPESSCDKNEDFFLNEVFKKFQTLAPGEQSYYSEQFMKLMDGNYQLTPIQQPKFSTNHNFRG